MHRGYTTQRAAEYYQLLTRGFSVFPGLFVSGFRIQIEPGFGDSALAEAVTAVIENQDAKPNVMQSADIIDSVRNIPCVTVAKEQERGTRWRGHDPAVEAHAVTCLEPQILVRKPLFRRSAIKVRVGEKDLFFDKTVQSVCCQAHGESPYHQEAHRREPTVGLAFENVSINGCRISCVGTLREAP